MHHVAAKPAPRFQMTDLQVLRGTAVFAAPTISLQHIVSDKGVFLRFSLNLGCFCRRRIELAGSAMNPYG